MQYTQGLMQKFQRDRVPNDIEKASKLEINQHASNLQNGNDSLLSMNNCYLEVTDPYSAIKGIIEIPLFIGFSVISIIFPIAIWIIALEKWNNPDIERGAMFYVFYIFFTAIAPVVAYGFIKAIRYNFFSYKNWPVRFNRKNRTVYIFSSNTKGEVLIAPWEEIFFFLAGEGENEGAPCLRGYILDNNGIIRNGFAFGWSLNIGSDKTLLLQQWEFIRRYMEEGPEGLPLPQRYVSRDPGFWACQRHMFSTLRVPPFIGVAGLWIMTGMLDSYLTSRLTSVMGPIFTIFGFGPGLFRYLAYKTSRTPQWPAEVEAACQVEPNDPYLHPRAGDKVY